jgi:hypothetical protein
MRLRFVLSHCCVVFPSYKCSTVFKILFPVNGPLNLLLQIVLLWAFFLGVRWYKCIDTVVEVPWNIPKLNLGQTSLNSSKGSLQQFHIFTTTWGVTRSERLYHCGTRVMVLQEVPTCTSLCPNGLMPLCAYRPVGFPFLWSVCLNLLLIFLLKSLLFIEKIQCISNLNSSTLCSDCSL